MSKKLLTLFIWIALFATLSGCAPESKIVDIAASSTSRSRNNRTGSLNPNQPNPADSSLELKALDIEDRLERNFRFDGFSRAIPNHTESDLTSATIKKYDGTDSTLFTGTYLASLCLKYAMVKDPYEKNKTLDRAKSILSALESHRKITGIPGLVARYIYRDNSFPLPDDCSQTQHWESGSGEFSQYHWCGLTSRDQMHGYFAGLASCLVYAPSLKSQVSQIIYDTLMPIKSNGWKIPYGTYESKWESFNAREITANSRIAFASLAKRAIDRLILDAQAKGDNTLAGRLGSEKIAFETDLSQEYDMISLRMLLEQEWIRKYMEYYSLNLASLATWITTITEGDFSRKEVIKKYYWTKIWGNSWNHKNPQLTFVKMALIGSENLNILAEGDLQPDLSSPLREARDSVYQLAFRERESKSTQNSVSSDCVRDADLSAIQDFITTASTTFNSKELDYYLLNSKLAKEACKDALPVSKRGFMRYAWEESPFRIPAAASTTFNQRSPAVDVLFAYWLGRSVNAFVEGE